MLKRSPKVTGFTLIEILIAVAVLAIALTAVIRVIDVAINNQQHLQQKTVAHWVAMNVLAEVRAGVTLPPAAGATQDGQSRILGYIYPWQVSATNVPQLPIVKINVRVFNRDKRSSLETLQMFMQPAGVPNASR